MDIILLKVNLNFNEEFLLGISAFSGSLSEKDIAYFKEDIEDEATLSKIDFIAEKSKQWTKLDVWKKANSEHEHHASNNLGCDKYSFHYDGYLLNHSKHLAVDLKDYFELSEFRLEGSDKFTRVAIDPIPALTETGEGLPMALFNGTSITTTYHLGGSWCGDLLEIKDEMPSGYKLIDCCFVGIWERAKFLYYQFGLDSEDYITSDEKGTRYEAFPFGLAQLLHGKPPKVKVHVKRERSEDGDGYDLKTVLIEDI